MRNTTTRNHTLVAVALLALLMPFIRSSAVAQQEPASPNQHEKRNNVYQQLRDGRVDVDVEEAPLEQILRQITKSLDLSLTFLGEGKKQPRFSLTLQDVPALAVVRFLLHQTSWLKQVQPEGLLVARGGEMQDHLILEPHQFRGISKRDGGTNRLPHSSGNDWLRDSEQEEIGIGYVYKMAKSMFKKLNPGQGKLYNLNRSRKRITLLGLWSHHRLLHRLIDHLRTIGRRSISFHGGLFRISSDDVDRLESIWGLHSQKEGAEVYETLRENGSMLHRISTRARSGERRRLLQFEGKRMLANIDPQVATGNVSYDMNTEQKRQGTGVVLVPHLNVPGNRVFLKYRLLRNRYEVDRDRQMNLQLPRSGSGNGKNSGFDPVPVRREYVNEGGGSLVMKTDQWFVKHCGPMYGSADETRGHLVLAVRIRENAEDQKLMKPTIAEQRRQTFLNRLSKITYKKPDSLDHVPVREIIKHLRNKLDINVAVTNELQTRLRENDFALRIEKESLSVRILLDKISVNFPITYRPYSDVLVMRTGKESGPGSNILQVYKMKQVMPPGTNLDLPNAFNPAETNQNKKSPNNHGFLGGSFTETGNRNDKTYPLGDSRKFRSYLKNRILRVDSGRLISGNIRVDDGILAVRHGRNIQRAIRDVISKKNFFPRTNRLLNVTIQRVPKQSWVRMHRRFPGQKPLSEQEEKRYRENRNKSPSGTRIGSWTLSTAGFWKARASSVRRTRGISDYDIQVATNATSANPIFQFTKTGYGFEMRATDSSFDDRSNVLLKLFTGKKTGDVSIIDKGLFGDRLSVPVESQTIPLSWISNGNSTILHFFTQNSGEEYYVAKISYRNR